MVHYEDEAATGDVRMYASGVEGDLAPFLDVVVETGGHCRGFEPESVAFTGTLAEMPGGWVAARPSWGAHRGGRRAYRVAVTLRPGTPAEGLHASADLVWEARSPAAARAGG